MILWLAFSVVIAVLVLCAAFIALASTTPMGAESGPGAAIVGIIASLVLVGIIGALVHRHFG